MRPNIIQLISDILFNDYIVASFITTISDLTSVAWVFRYPDWY